MVTTTAAYEVSISQFVGTEVSQVIDHFICKICSFVVFQPKECSKCEQPYCHDCVQLQIARNKKWKCFKCGSEDPVIDLHRVVKEILNQLIFKCPLCSQKRSYVDILKHVGTCKGEGDGNIQMPVLQKKESIVSSVRKNVESLSIVNMKGLDIYIMEKDSKKFYIYNTLDQQVQTHQINTQSNFPHNFQAIQVGETITKAYIVGGGDFNALPDTMFQINQICKNEQGGYFYEPKEKMKYARHGHSCASLGEIFVVVTGSRKDVNNAQSRCEIFNTEENEWYEMGLLNNGRHYHSSCTYNSSYIYIFCGISNQTKKYLNTIERLAINIDNIQGSKQNAWEALDVKDLILVQPRQGAGVCQVSQSEILIVGGFHGKFSNETFFLDTKLNKVRKAYNELKDNIFPFQVPTLADPLGKSVYTVDWQTYKLYEFKNDKWEFKKKIRP